jgi:hypothetical protein
MFRALALTLCLAGCAETTANRPVHPGGSVGLIAGQYARSGGSYASGDYYSADNLILSQRGTRVDPNATFNFHAGSSPFVTSFMQGAMPSCMRGLIGDGAFASSAFTTVTGAQIKAACPGRY